MLFLEELDDLRLYSSRRKMYIPIDPANRKKGAAIMLLSKNSVDSHTMMNLPYIHNPKLYESLYIDRNVNALIDTGAIIDEKDEELAVNEAMQHDIEKRSDEIKVAIDCKTSSINDAKILKSVYNEKTFKKWYKFFKTSERYISRDIKIEAYPSLKDAVGDHQVEAMKQRDVISRSYSYNDTIVVVAKSGYKALESREGEYEKYLLNELITFVAMKTSRHCNRYLANHIGTALSGQLDNKLYDKITDNYGNIDDYEMATSYMVKKMYDEQGRNAIIKLCHSGDYSMLSRYASRSIIKNISTMFSESTNNVFNENYLFTKENIELNKEEWHSKKSNFLFITGLSGSGKSTLAREIADENKAEYVEMDMIIESMLNPTYATNMVGCIKEYWESADKHETAIGWADPSCHIEVNNFINWMEKNKRSNGKLYVIEGCCLFLALPTEYIASQPLIVMGTSSLVSMLRRGKRAYIKQIDKGNGHIQAFIKWIKAIKNSLHKHRFSKNELLLRQFEELLQSATSLNESAGVSYEPVSLYDDVMHIVDKLSGEERSHIAFDGKYEDSDRVINRAIKRDESGNPIGFIDAYKFDNRPHEAQLVVALDPEHRGKGHMRNMLGEYITHPIYGHKGISKFIWFADPMNDRSVKLATSCGFKKNGKRRYREDLGIYEDMYEYEIPFREDSMRVNLPVDYLRESVQSGGYSMTDDYIMTENFITFFNGMDTQTITEAEKKYDNKLKQYLFKERLKNNKAVLMRYEELKVMNPWIKRTFLKLAQYQRHNLFIDMSFYHALFLKNLKFNKDAAIKMYWDFINRLINDSEYKTLYPKMTIFIPVWPDAWEVKNAEGLMDYKQSINPISLIIRMLRKSPNDLKKWGNKDILFVSPNGYFKLNFTKFELKDLAKFRRFITKLTNNESIDDDENEDGYTTSKEVDSTAVITANVVDKIENGTGIKIDDLSGGTENPGKPEELADVFKPSLNFTHLRVRAEGIKLPKEDYANKDNNTKNAVLILAPDGDSAANGFIENPFDKSFFNKRGFYSP